MTTYEMILVRTEGRVGNLIHRFLDLQVDLLQSDLVGAVVSIVVHRFLKFG